MATTRKNHEIILGLGRPSRGFSLIETMVATVISATIMSSMLLIIPASFSVAQQDGIRVQAITAADEYLDTVREYIQTHPTVANLPAPSPPTIDAGLVMEGSGDSSQSPGSFTISLANNTCSLVSGAKVLYDCQVTATWQQGGSTHSETVESYATRQI